MSVQPVARPGGRTKLTITLTEMTQQGRVSVRAHVCTCVRVCAYEMMQCLPLHAPPGAACFARHGPSLAPAGGPMGGCLSNSQPNESAEVGREGA